MGWEEEYNALRKRRATAKGKLTRKVTLLKEGVDRGDPLSACRSNYEGVLKAFQCLEVKNDEILDFVVENSLETRLEDEAQQYILESEREKNVAQALICKVENEQDVSCKPKVKVKAFEPPKFCGNIREYPNFKEDFKNLVMNVYGADPYALRMCLSGDALQTVRGAEGSYDEMFERLDDKYGNARKIVDLVISDLKCLRKIADGDTESFIKMVDQVEQCWLDLKRVNLSDELNTANVVSNIERILPSLQKREWVMMADKVSTKDELFPELLEFLKREKKVLEYMNSNVRTSTSGKALAHHVNNAEAVADSELLNLLRKMSEDQQAKNKEFESCIVSLTEMVRGTNVKTENNCGGCWLHDSASHDIVDCHKFKAMNSKNRFEMAKNHGICFKCLRGNHSARNCKVGRLCDVIIEGQGPCNWNHHPLLHHEQKDGVFHNAVSGKACTALLNISQIFSGNQPLTVLWDSGSDVSLITHKMARKLGLRGKDIKLSMIKVGNVIEKQASKEYCVPLVDKTGRIWNVDVVGINEISATIKKIDLSTVPGMFAGISLSDVYRPSGEIDVLIGTNYSELLPRVIQTNKGLQLLENQFGLSIRGRHNEINSPVNTNHNIVVRTHKLSSMVHLNEISVESEVSLKDQLDRFFTIEDRGVECDKECAKCLCRGCPGPEFVNLKEERELALIENGLVYDDEHKCWTANYPWIKDPNQLRNNIKVAAARLRTTENRLIKLGTEYAKKYQGEIEDMVRRRVARKLSDKEIKDYKGPIHYIHHHEVLKPESSSTPLRIVFNSSASYMGQKLNDFWAKGPNVLNNLLGVLFRFRQEKVAIAGDIAKMYHTIKISMLDQHTHRFLWRDLGSSGPPDHYVLTSVTFGDRPSGAIATLALRQTVHKFGSECPEVKDLIMNNTYVDDILHSTNSVDKAFNLIRDTEKILSLGSFHVKYWVISGCHEKHDINVMDSSCEKILGLKWKPKEDYFFFTVNVNFSPRVRKIRSGPNLRRWEVEAKFPQILTRRMILSQVATLYDPLGFAVPVLLQAKLLMRSMITRLHTGDDGIGWDDPLETSMVNKWKQFFVNLYELEELSFRRNLKPSNALGRPSLIIFSDGSMQAYGACAYVRWQVEENKFAASLIVAKNKVAPIKQLSIPRLELCGALLAARLRETIVKQFDWDFESVFHIVDSSIVRSQIQRESHGFNTFVAVRIAEIQTKTDPREWWWIDSSLNVADLTSRPCSPKEIGRHSTWQNGPKFLTSPVSEWPIRQTCEEQVPDRTGIIMTIAKDSKDVTNCSIFQVERFSNYSKLLKVTCRVRAVFTCKSLKGIFRDPTTEEIKKSEIMWVKEMQKNLTDWEVRFKRLGPKLNDDGVITVGERISKWLKENWNQESFVLLPSNHPVTKLYILSLHERDHAGIETTLAKLQRKFWVPGARKVIKSIKEKCVVCRKLEKRTENQCMGQVRAERLKPAPPFYHTAVDLFGPFTIKDTVKRRTHSKAYGVIFNCLVTRAVYLDLAEGYNTEDFLSTFQRFIAIRGSPKFMYSDKGTQLVSASKRLESVGKEEGVTWSFYRPGDAPWYNGASEALIKSVKRCLCITVGESVLTFGDLQTAMFSVSNMINERPIGLKPGFSLELGSYLCPNDLLLGRSSNHCPSGLYDVNTNFKRRLVFVQRIVDSFWKKWQRDYFPTMLCRQKWHTTRRNVRVGDVVLVQDSNAVRGAWKLAQVIRATKGCDGNVREVDLRYKLIKEGKGYDGSMDKIMSRSVHRLVVLLPIEEQM